MTDPRSTRRAWTALAAAGLALAAAGCLKRSPETHFYQLSPPGPARGDAGRGDPVAGPPAAGGDRPVIVVEPLETEAAYDDERMVYRRSPYRLDYYHYHRWSSPPGELVAAYLERWLERTGRFGAVVRESTPQASAFLRGRITALEELDVSSSRWKARIALELRLVDASTGDLLWSQEFDETVPMEQQSPEGLAEAVSRGLARVAGRAGPQVARAAGERDRARAEARRPAD